MIWFYRFLIGFLAVEFSGDITEVILNICAKNGITLWGIKRKDKNIRCYITVRDFKVLPKITQKSGIRVHIFKKYGFPFITERYKKRFGIPVGVAVFFLFLKLMSLFIWTVEVEGNHKVSNDEIISACKEIGAYEGVFKNNIVPKTASQELLLKFDKIAWASLNIEGSRLTVNVTETVDKTADKSTPTNLNATDDGKIVKIDINSGNCLVKVGDIVAKGDLLVSGIIEKASHTDFVHSEGEIIAEFEKEITVKSYFKRKIATPTGEKNKKSTLSFFRIKIPLFLGRENGNYNSEFKVKQAKLFGENLPIKLYTASFEKTEEKEIILSEKALKEELENLLIRELQVENISDFKVQNREFDEIKGGISLKATVLVRKNIGEKKILLFSTGN